MVTLSMDLSMDVQGRHVLLVEDIVETGCVVCHRPFAVSLARRTNACPDDHLTAERGCTE